MLDIANDIRFLSDFKRNTSELFDRLKKTGTRSTDGGEIRTSFWLLVSCFQVSIIVTAFNIPAPVYSSGAQSCL